MLQWLDLSSFLSSHKGSLWRSELEGIASGAEQLVQHLLKENWSGASGFTSGCVVVLVNRSRTAQYLANHLSNCLELQLHNIRTTCVGNGGSTDDEGKSTFHLSELAGQIVHFANGMHQFEQQFIWHLLWIPLKWRTRLSKCAILKNLTNQSFKLVHSIYRPTSLTGQLWQKGSALSLDNEQSIFLSGIVECKMKM